MRVQFCDAMVARAKDPDLVFLTGDLGFMALEPLAAALGQRFINAGVAEQNMVSVAAALAKDGFSPWVYSIAPFAYARPFEQIRNDVCLHGLRVRVVGNGGGYGYGVMGPSHHAIADYGALLTLPGMAAVVPVFDQDLSGAVAAAADSPGPCYLRLGRGEAPAGATIPPYAPWRQLVAGDGPVVIAVGPIAGSAWATFAQAVDGVRANVWAVAELPLRDPPPALLAQLAANPRLLVIEEHVATGSLGADLARWLLLHGRAPAFRHLHAVGYVSGRYGSQPWHRKESGLDPEAMRAAITALGRP